MHTKSRSQLLPVTTVLLALGSFQLTQAETLSSPCGIAQQGHTDSVHEKRPLLAAGVQFTEDMLPTAADNDEWYWIPQWYTGTWHRDSVTTLSIHDHKEHTTRKHEEVMAATTDDYEGWQRDNQGDCWNCSHTPFRSECHRETTRQIFMVTALEPVSVTSDQVVKKFSGTGILIDKTNGTVIHSARAESLQTYRLVHDGQISSTAITTEYDDAGNPTTTTQTVSIYRRTAEFRAHDQHAGKDMRSSFKSFLLSHGKAQLIPTELSMLP